MGAWSKTFISAGILGESMTRATLLAYSATAGAALGVVACWLLLSRAARSSADDRHCFHA